MLEIKSFTFNAVQENTYVLYDTTSREAAIVDPGCMTQTEQGVLRRFVEERGLTPTMMLCTHQHFDHVWGAAFVLREWPQMAAYGHRIDFEMLPLASEQLRGYGISIPLEDVPRERYTLVEEDEVIELGGSHIRVLFVPGHAPGHIAFYVADSHILLSGDTLLRDTIGRTDFWYGSYDQLLESIRTRYLPLPDATTVYSGHGPETTIGYEREHNPFL